MGRIKRRHTVKFIVLVYDKSRVDARFGLTLSPSVTLSLSRSEQEIIFRVRLQSISFVLGATGQEILTSGSNLAGLVLYTVSMWPTYTHTQAHLCTEVFMHNSQTHTFSSLFNIFVVSYVMVLNKGAYSVSYCPGGTLSFYHLKHWRQPDSRVDVALTFKKRTKEHHLQSEG